MSREKIINTTCACHCGGTCVLKVHVVDGRITRIETDDGEEPQYRACARGRAHRQRVYAADRLKYPMKRVGKRGDGKFERVSWDEALDVVAGELTRVKQAYGPAAILLKKSAGDIGRLHGSAPHQRLLSLAGGCSDVWGTHSFEGATFAQIATFGSVATTNSRDDLLNSRLILLWGWNPTDTVLLTSTSWYLAQAREAGARFVSIDPRYTKTAALCDSEWIPIKPGTDAAMLIAMAYVIIKEDLQDQTFLDTCTFGFQQYKEYVTGAQDGIPKTPGWAEAITGVPASRIERLATEYATMKPAALMAGIGPGRSAYGEQYHRASATLAAMTGNTGIHGGDAGISAFTYVFELYPEMKLGRLPVPPNPVESNAPPRKNAFPSWGDCTLSRPGNVNQTKVADAILKGRAGAYPTDYKLLYVVNNNYPNQYLNLNKCVQAMQAETLEFIVVFDQFMTPAAKFADILLPVNTFFERNDVTTGGTVGFYGSAGKAIDSVGESMSHLEACSALAAKLGISDYNDKTEDEWLKEIVATSPHIPDYEAFKRDGGYKVRRPQPYVAFEEQVKDPEHNVFPTPTGKIEIYCQRLADMNDPLIPPIPKYFEPWESPNDTLARKYPLQLITTHFWRRAHSQFDNIPWLLELEPQRVWVNPADAEARGIKDGDTVTVFNDRGTTRLQARVTERIMPGVVDIPEGAWYDPDEEGVDRGGNANVLTRDEHSPGGAYCSNTSLVQIRRAYPVSSSRK